MMATWHGLLILGLLLAGASLLFLRMNRIMPDQPKEAPIYTLEGMTDYIKHTLHELTSANLSDYGLSEEEYRRRKSKRAELKRALRGATSGDLRDKQYVKQVITDLLTHHFTLDEVSLNRLIPFESPEQLTSQDHFDILLHTYKQQHGYEALSQLIQRYALDDAKLLEEEGNEEVYRITAEEIAEIYEQEQPTLEVQDKLELVVQRIYQQYKGFSVVDELRDMHIDGISGGVSGIPPSVWEGEGTAQERLREVPRSYDSVWLFYQGKSIHLSFLSFGSEQELRRVCQNIYKHNFPGQLVRGKRL